MQQSLVRWMEGERPGMSADRHILRLMTPAPEEHPIAIQNQVRITDVSFYQGQINFLKMLSAGIGGSIIRAGQRYWVDSRFKENWANAKVARMARGTYWFWDSRDTPENQARLWWDQVKNDPAELVYVADFEESYGGAYGSRSHMIKFMQEFQRLSGIPNHRLVVYTGYYWWGGRVGNDPFFSGYPLWLAWYSAMANVQIPRPWIEDQLIFWQYTSSGNGLLYGVSSAEIDLNWYCCSRIEYDKLIGGGNPMQIIKGEVLGQVYVRTGPGSTYGSVEGLYPGDQIEASQNQFQWLKLTKIIRKGGGVLVPPTNVEWWASSGANQVYIRWAWVDDVPPPPPPPESVEYFLHVVDGITRRFILDPNQQQ